VTILESNLMRRSGTFNGKAILAVIACGALLAGCGKPITTDDDIPGPGIGERELRIDAFSHWWNAERAKALAVHGDTLFGKEGWTGVPQTTDLLILLDHSLDRSATLPAHTVQEIPGEGHVVFYTATGVVDSFSCTRYHARRGFQEWDDYTQAHGREPVLDSVRFRRVTATYSSIDDYVMVDVDSMVPSIGHCGYVPGKGFFLWYGYFPWAVGEVVFRY
jgi:hypothetical protein